MRQWLKSKRESAGLTQQQLADQLKKDITTIGKWENGSRCPKPKTAMELGLLLDFDWQRFYTDNDKTAR